MTDNNSGAILGQMFKRMVFALGERNRLVPWAMNLVRFNALALGWLPSRFSDERRRYTAEAGHIGSMPDATYHNDLSLNFFARALIEHRYEVVIELGAFSLERSKWLAAHFQNVEVHALDITQDFRDQHEIDGVHVGPNSLEHIRKIAAGRRGIVVATGTLCCYTREALAELFAMLKELQIDLAFNEPNTSGEGSLTRSLRRTSQSYYHPYLSMLHQAGFTLPDGNGHQIRDCWGEYAETRTFIFASARP